MNKGKLKYHKTLLPGFSYLFCECFLHCYIFFCAIDWSRLIIVLKFSVFLGCPFPDLLARERRLLLDVLSISIGISRLLLQDSFGWYEAKENSGDSLLYQSSSSSLYLLMFGFYIMFTFQIYLTGGVEKSTPIPTSQKRKAWCFFFSLLSNLRSTWLACPLGSSPAKIVLKFNSGSAIWILLLDKCGPGSCR